MRHPESRSPVRMLAGDLGAGLLWFAGMLAYDAWTSWTLLRKAMRKVRHDPAADEMLRGAVVGELLRMVLLYALMGLVAGLWLWLVRRARGDRRPWRPRLVAVAAVTTWMSLSGAIRYPLLYVGVPGMDWWTAHVHPGWMDAALLVGLGAWVLAGWRRARPTPAWLAALAAATLLVSVADRHPPAPRPRRNAGPNVVVIGMDALRPDHLAHFGYERNTAPALEEFLAEATVFENAVTPLPRTWPAYTTILTGTHPVTHGQRMSLPQPGHERPRNGVRMITDALVEAGWDTWFLTDDSRFSYMVPAHNFRHISQPPVNAGAFALTGHEPHVRPFAAFANGPLGWLVARAWRYNEAFGATWTPDAFAEHVAEAIGRASRGSNRFLVVVHSCVLHAPAQRTWPYHLMYGMAKHHGSNRYRYRSTGSKVADIALRMSDERLVAAERRGRQQTVDLYDAGIAELDLLWRRVARALDEGDLWENTLVIVLSDHGEDFFEEGQRYRFRAPNHGYHPWGTGQSRVVLALRGGGFGPAERRELVSLDDVAPTIARFAGVDLPTAEGVPLQDPVPERVLFGETGVSEPWYWPPGHVRAPFEHLSERYAVDPETDRIYQRPEMEPAIVASKDFWALDSEWWLVRESMEDGPRLSLFRWHEDPVFVNDLSAEHPDVVARLAAALRARLGEPDPEDAADVGLTDAAPPAGTP